MEFALWTFLIGLLGNREPVDPEVAAQHVAEVKEFLEGFLHICVAAFPLIILFVVTINFLWKLRH